MAEHRPGAGADDPPLLPLAPRPAPAKPASTVTLRVDAAAMTPDLRALRAKAASLRAADRVAAPPADLRLDPVQALHPVSNRPALHGTEETTDACQGLGTVCQGRGHECHG
ncbi:hypothetical protein GCM10010964_43390 [Caldovatus sediminis]|uniref:Uncharacterized protein n=1 Tax=Caldovatus sediminis TaxID=2041189 RepID=A0A8J2ZFW5_9PROT|nr:hypothetical protein GCM10010964_43390 [Caldovatus sediminis]